MVDFQQTKLNLKWCAQELNELQKANNWKFLDFCICFEPLLHGELIFMSVSSVRLLWLAAHLLGFTPSRGLFSPLLGCHHHTATTQTYTHRHTYKHRHTYRRTHLHTHRRTHKRTAHTSTIAAHLKTRLHSGNTWTQCELLHAKLKDTYTLQVVHREGYSNVIIFLLRWL